MCTQKLNRNREIERYSARFKCFYCVERNDEFSFFFCTISHNNYGRNLSRFGLSPYPNPPLPPTHIDMMMIYSICAMKRKRFVCSLRAAVVVGCHSLWLLQFHRSGSSLWESCYESRLPCSAFSSLISPSSHLHAPSAHLPLNVFRNCC